MFKGIKPAIPFLALFLTASAAFAQSIPGSTAASAVLLSRGDTGPYVMVEKSDWSRYDNGRYTGHVYREVRASIMSRQLEGTASLLYQGNFFVLEETLRDLQQSARAVDDIIAVSFEVFSDGNLRIQDDRGYPALRGFPVFPAAPVAPGTKWTASGSRAVDPLNEGSPVVVPLLAEYEYQGTDTYKGIPVYHITAKYASRYQSGYSGGYSGYSGGQSNADRRFSRLQGTHNVDIFVRISDGLPLLMRDLMDETYTWPDGKTVRFRGFTLNFGETSIPWNRDAIIASIGGNLGLQARDAAGGDSEGDRVNHNGGSPSTATTPQGQVSNSDSGNLATGLAEVTMDNGGDNGPDLGIALYSVPEGIRLTVRDVRFRADSDEILPTEQSRLDIIAQVLLEIPDRFFLVEGHTAAIGRAAAEMELSILRARRIVDELSRRGIAAERFIYKGWGGTKPIGDNATESGRQLNRRVEITILE
jgi:outer membrane protein OmpA-like peptidoglycan-associated protein